MVFPKLAKMSDAELDALQRALEVELRRREELRRTATKDRILQLADESGLSKDELVALLQGGRGSRGSRGKPGKQGKQGKVAPKYRDPQTGQTWSGRGRSPVWMRQALEAGKSKEDFAIQPEP